MAVRGNVYIQAESATLSYDDALTIPAETHSFGNDVVAQTLEDGSLIVDHIVILQDELEVQIFVSNSKSQESQDIYSALKTIRNNRELCKVYTDHEIYSNMAIESVSAPHEAPMVNCMTFTVKFKRVDWTGDIKNTYPPKKFQIDELVGPISMPARRGVNLNMVGMQEAINGNLGAVDRVDMTACSFQDIGDLTGQEAV